MLLGLPTGLLRPLILDSTHATYDGPASWVLGVKLSNHLRAAVALIALSIVSHGVVDSLDLGRLLTLTQ